MPKSPSFNVMHQQMKRKRRTRTAGMQLYQEFHHAHDVLLIIGDMNTEVGSDNTSLERAMGRHGCGTMNDNEKRLVEFCLENNCAIGGTILPHKDIHKITWNSPDGKTTNHIDQIVIKY